MPRRLNWEQLTSEERRVAHLSYAGASQEVIAYLAEISQPTVKAILDRPKIQNYLLKLAALNGQELEQPIQDLSKAIESEADRAFEVEREAMERLFALDDVEDKRYVQAQLGAAATAQDILDRAGRRAPTKIDVKKVYEVAPATIEALGRIMKQARQGREASEGGEIIDIALEKEEPNAEQDALIDLSTPLPATGSDG